MPRKLNQLVRDSQNGDEAATLDILYRFGWRKKGRWENFLGKYDKLLWHGRVDMKNKDTRRFLKLFISDKETRRLLTYSRQNYAVTMSAQETANFIQNLVRQHYTREELRQDLLVYFIELIHKYKKKPHINFAGYIMGYFHFRAYWMLHSKLFKYDTFMLTNHFTQDEVPHEESGYELKEEVIDPLSRIEQANDELGIFWVNGRCSPLFEDLSILDRMILRDSYVFRLSDADIGTRYGYHRNSILKKRHKAIKHLKEKQK